MAAHAQTALPLAIESLLTIVGGPEQGTIYKISGQQITIGRGTDNDIVLKDTKASRNHAKIEFNSGEYKITDLGSQNGIVVNGQIIREQIIKSGDVLQIGTTHMKFSLSSPTAAVAPHFSQQKPSTNDWVNSYPKTNNHTLIVVVGIILALVFIFSQRNTFSKKTIHLKDDAAFEEELQNTIEGNDLRQQDINKKGLDTQQYQEAQAFYKRGFREYRESNYTRAIQNFEASLALYPMHPLAKRYLERSQLKLNESITSALERGERYFNLQKYDQAENEYRTVIILSGEMKTKSAQLATKRRETIRLIKAQNR